MEDARTDHTATRQPYGTLGSGESVDRITLSSPRLRVEAVTYGARIVSVSAPDSAGELGEVALGLADLAAYEKDHSYLGACVGRYANRIAGGRFVLDDRTFEVSTNEPADSPSRRCTAGDAASTPHCGRRRSGRTPRCGCGGSAPTERWAFPATSTSR